jgi:uncharacterized protein (TIGR00290 family)
MKLFVSWSGGKDCSFAAYRALKAGHELACLVSMFTLEVGRMYPHHFTPEILKGQAEAMDLPILLNWTSAKEYTKNYIKMLKELKKKGVTGGVFGDVSRGNPDADEHRQWIDEVCRAAEMEVYLPLWDEDREQIIGEMISSGFESVIIAADDNNLGEAWLGKRLDSATLARLKTLHRNSHNGEVGLYHTFVTDGPLFKRRVQLDETEVVYRKYGLYDGKPTISPFWYIDIKSFHLLNKVKGEDSRPR